MGEAAPAAALLSAGGAFKAGSYVLHPPQQNAGLVRALVENPASRPGEPLLLLGASTDKWTVEFYSDSVGVLVGEVPEGKRPKVLRVPARSFCPRPTEGELG